VDQCRHFAAAAADRAPQPEVVTTLINHRVNIASSISDVVTHIWETLLPVAKEYNLAMSGLGMSFTPEKGAKGQIYLSQAFEKGHEHAPLTPTDLGTAAWRLVAGTSRGMWASRREVSPDGRLVELKEEDELIMAPYMSTGVSPGGVVILPVYSIQSSPVQSSPCQRLWRTLVERRVDQ
jgi:hypothetical protein